MIKNIIYVFIAVIFLSAYFRYFEYRSVYFPTKEIEFTPRVIGLSYEDIYLDTEDGAKLNAWLIPAGGSEYTILFCHGNGGNISHRLEKILILNQLGLDVFIFDYRGYGKSSGRPSERGLYRDAHAVHNYLISEKRILPERVILYGESLGGAVAVDLAAKKSVRALIIESAFTSAKDMAKAIYPFLPAFFISYKFNTLANVKHIDAPKLIIHSRNDEIVPFRQSIKLLQASPEPKKHLVLMGSHNTCYADSRALYISGIRDFLKTL